jgi:hypothetical protein
MATVMRVAGDKEGDGKGCKGNGDGNKVCRSKIVRTLWIPQRWEALHQRYCLLSTRDMDWQQGGGAANGLRQHHLFAHLLPNAVRCVLEQQAAPRNWRCRTQDMV